MSTQPQQQQQSSSEEGSKENTIISGSRHQRGKKYSGSSFRPSRQHATRISPCSTHITSWRTTMRLPQSTVKTGITRIHWNTMKPPMDPPEHLWIMAKAQELLRARNKVSEPHPGTSSGTGSATQPADSSKNTIVCSACGKSGHWSRNCPYYNFCDFCRVTTHSTHMCRATKCRPRSPVCIYCGKTNHSSAYCRYRPRDNQEEPRNTPDALKNGNYW